jgi:transketolase
MRETFGRTLVELGHEDPRIVVLDNDVNDTTHSDYFKDTFGDRFIEVGIAEKNLFGIAAGLARSGFIPFPTTFAAFAVRCALDQIAFSAGFGNLDVKIPGHYIGGSRAGASHIPVEDMAVMRAIPNFRVADPADNADLVAVMRAAVSTPGPVYFRVNKFSVPTVFGPDHSFAWGRGERLLSGGDVTLIGTGILTIILLRTADLLAQEGVECDVLHLASVKPLDAELVVASVRKTGCAVVAENASVIGGLGSAIAEVLSELEPTPLRRVGYQDVWVHSGSISQILDRHGLRPAAIAESVRAVIKQRDSKSSEHTRVPEARS